MVFFSLCIITAALESGCVGVRTPSITQSDPPGVFLDYQRTGGIAGVNDRLVIFDNGVSVISSRMINSEVTLNKTELDQISNLLRENKFSSLEGNYTSRRGGADLMQYTLTYRGKTIRTEDTAVPPALQPVLDEMNRILALGLMHGPMPSPAPADLSK
jgi:hypothetical protein